jgi:hypothetical protein
MEKTCGQMAAQWSAAAQLPHLTRPYGLLKKALL